MNPDDASFLTRVWEDGDSHAYGELVKRHQSMKRNLLRHWLKGQEALAEDLAQETFIKAYRNIRQFQGQSSFSTWLTRIAYREFLSCLRRSRPQINLEGMNHEPMAPSQRIAEDFQADLQWALGRLSSEERVVVVCCAIEGMTHIEAAQVVGWPLGTVKTHLLKGKEKLRLLLADWESRD